MIKITCTGVFLLDDHLKNFGKHAFLKDAFLKVKHEYDVHLSKVPRVVDKQHGCGCVCQDVGSRGLAGTRLEVKLS